MENALQRKACANKNTPAAHKATGVFLIYRMKNQSYFVSANFDLAIFAGEVPG
jgi:hypothetical protein